MNYFLLQHPGHNRVYYDAAENLALAELTLASERFSTEVTNISVEELAGVRYLKLECASALSETDLQFVARLSFLFAVYQGVEVVNKVLLEPILMEDHHYIDPKISSLLKYKGKTNELFTRMMINVGLLSSAFGYEEAIRLLDPVAGRGTTLYEAAVYGYDAYGIELDQKSVHEGQVFFKKFLQEERMKHLLNKRQISGSKKSQATHLQEFTYAKDKDEFKQPDGRRYLGLIQGETQGVHDYFKKASFHLIIGDLPYGVHHAHNSEKKGPSPSRNPKELLAESIGEWKKVLYPGGVIVLAWNSNVASPKVIRELFEKAGLEVLDSEPYSMFVHQVDRAIKRDIVVARR
ncbi:MAG: hypothetical protein MK081_09460 [Flavobacteriales bacterium]|nr:hypothetical protein [Flavobacteriales bacterium]